MGEGSLALVHINLKLSCPSVEQFAGGLTPERANVGEWHARLAECIYHLRVSQLARRVVAIPRAGVHRCWCEQALGPIGSQPFS